MQVDDENLKQILSQNIKSARLSSGLTQENLAELSHISTDFLKSIESSRSGISISTLINICNALEITPNELLKNFFIDSYTKRENIVGELQFLNDYQLDTINALIQHFFNNKLDK